ncbi:MAG: hypothetical protein DRO12_03040 [Thermoprotei archaeon]|nr:MAG: hypothetical protein DRO12_03040 [Thermoprotei archaeon]
MNSYSAKIKEALSSRRILLIRYREEGRSIDLWIFHGVERDYLLIPGRFCTCHDYVVNVASRGIKKRCYHIQTLDEAVNRGMYRVLELSNYEVVKQILLEVILRSRSNELRRLLSQYPRRDS